MVERVDISGGRAGRLLLVEEDDMHAGEIEAMLRQQMPDLEMERARGFRESTGLIESGRFDVVLTDQHLADGTGLDILTFVTLSKIHIPVVVMSGHGGEEVAVAAMRAGADDFIRRDNDMAYLQILPFRLKEVLRRADLERRLEEMQQQKDELKLLSMIRGTVTAVNHDINNPLAIISGNAQLLLEIAKVAELDAEFVRPIRDIEEASRRIAAALQRLYNLKEFISRHDPPGQDSSDPNS